jgi:ribosome-associated heat shock protein Hsp15
MKPKVPSSEPTTPGVRIDVWLWATRFFKTRALAKHATEGGKIELNGASIAKSAKIVHIGDRLRIVRGEEIFQITVTGVTEQRGPAAVARTHYEEKPEDRATREAAAQQRRLEAAGYSRPATKPDKRARRLLRALGDIDMS